jgi:growth factor-regulated tyrosine kinase substrate
MEDMDYQEGVYASKKEWQKSKQCKMCNAGYSLIQREHHCRSCGWSVCGDCSQGLTYMQEFGMKNKSRCCNVCTARGFD